MKTWYLFPLLFHYVSVTLGFWSYNHTNYFHLTTLPQLFLSVGRNLCLPSYQSKHRYQVFDVFLIYPLFFMYLSHHLKLRAWKWHILSTYWIIIKEMQEPIKCYKHYSTTSHNLHYHHNWPFLFTENFFQDDKYILYLHECHMW